MTYIALIFPTFLDGITFVAASTNQPDFLGECGGGRKIGLELTSWLNLKQVRAARGRQCMRENLLKIIEWEKHPRPRNFCSVVVMPRWGKPIRKNHYQGICNEFHAATQNVDNAWKMLRESHLRPEVLGRELRPMERFVYEMHESDPQWSPQNRPTVVRAKPANGKRPGTQLFYPAASCGGKSIFVRQLRGPHLST